jgi:hypothetical protein
MKSHLIKSLILKKAFKEQLDLKTIPALRKQNLKKDKLGFYEKFQLFHQGLKVEFSTYTPKSGKLESMSGEFYQLDNVNTNATLSKNRLLKCIKRNRRYKISLGFSSRSNI